MYPPHHILARRNVPALLPSSFSISIPITRPPSAELDAQGKHKPGLEIFGYLS
jgi:hypothetical protein